MVMSMFRAASAVRAVALGAVLIGGEAIVWWATANAREDLRVWLVHSEAPAEGWTLERVVVDSAAAGCLLLTLLLVGSAVLTLVSAGMGSAVPRLRAMSRFMGPRWWRELVLVACGLGLSLPVAAAAVGPTESMGRDPGRPPCTGLSGLPMPDLPINGASRQRPDSRAFTSRLPTVTVRAGDSLWLIAGRQLGFTATDRATSNRVADLYHVNRLTIGNDPDLVHPGQVLRLPGEPHD